MVERAREVKEDQAEAEDGKGYDLIYPPRIRRLYQQHNHSHRCEQPSCQVGEPVDGFPQPLLRSSSTQSASLIFCFGNFAGKGILPGEQENISAAHRRHLFRAFETLAGKSSRWSSYTTQGRLTSTIPAVIMVVADVSFWSCSTGSGHEGTYWLRSWR